MKKLADSFRAFITDEDGATMVEYGLMLALIAAVCIVAVALVGTSASSMFTTVAGSL
jgi:pilus assembly protein Flp/PilA